MLTLRLPSVSDPMPLHAVRVEDSLWQLARVVADERGESVSEVIREALRKYVTTPPPRK